jgi:glycosyltransferase involved in cell wall biosynthesis
MRVVIDTTYARRAPFSGTAIYLDRICQELARLDGVEIIPTSNARRRSPAGGGLGSARNLLADLWWSAVELPRRARRAGADLIHHPLPAIAPAAGVPQVVTVHDLAFERLPDCFDRAFRIYAHQTHRAAASAASAVICVSETTARDARAIWGVPGERIVIARHGPGQGLAAAADGRPREHFLYVGDDEPRKNVATLLAAYRTYREGRPAPLDLILTGAASADGPGVRVQRDPTAARLAELYAGAVALIHPSLYEGFGLTPLEAMSVGTPVIAARAPGLLEVCGDAVRYAEPRSPASFAAAMAEIESSAALQRELAECGRSRAAQFSWAASARAHVDAYSLALERG